jgi:hypothetical protein
VSAPSWCRAGYVLPRSSEVIVIDGLGQTLRMSLSVMRAMNPEVGAAVPPARGSALRVKVAERVIAQAESLLCALAEYRLAAEGEERRHGAPLTDDDIPF